jgi:translation initiation factor 1
MKKRPDDATGETRLVYSTEGGAVAPIRGASNRPQPAEPKAPARGPGGKGVRVRLERRPGGRHITTVLGLPGSDDELLALARDLRAACGAGGTVRGGVVELQGDQCDKVRRALEARGIRSR